MSITIFYRYVNINNTDRVLEVQLLGLDTTGSLIPVDTFEITTYSSYVIYNFNKIGTPMNYFKDCENRYNENLLITSNNFSDTINKNPNENLNWEWIVFNKSFPNGGHCACEFTVKQEDL